MLIKNRVQNDLNKGKNNVLNYFEFPCVCVFVLKLKRKNKNAEIHLRLSVKTILHIRNRKSCVTRNLMKN